MIKPEVLDAMLEAGCSAGQIVAAVKADAASEMLARDTRRAATALRQRRHRQSRDVTVTSCDKAPVTVTDADKKQTVSPGPPSKTKNKPPSPPSGALPPKKRGSRLATDWQLPPEWRDWAMVQGVAAERVDWEAGRFRDYWTERSDKGAAKLTWRGTWQNWIRKVIDDGEKKQSGGPGGRSDADMRRDMLQGLETTRGMGTGLRPARRRDP